MSDQIESFYKGDTKSWVLTFTRNGSAINLTGGKVYMTIKTKKSDADANATLQVTVTSHTTPASGITTVTLTSSQTNAFVAETTYYYDFRLIESGGTVTTVPPGTFTVKEPITKAVT